MPLQTYRHPIRFYVLLLLVTIFFAGLAIAAWMWACKAIPETGFVLKPMLTLVLGGLSSIAAIYYPVIFFKNTPRIRIDDYYIWFNSRQYSLSDIETIQFTGKRKMPVKFGATDLEAIIIWFKNGETRYAFDYMYSNLWAIKLHLYQTIDQRTHVLLPVIHSEVLVASQEETYKGNQFTSLRGLIAWGFALSMLLIVLLSPHPNGYLGLLLGFACLAFHSILMYYPVINNEWIYIKNHNFLWINRKIRLDTIRECVFEERGKSPHCLRIITKDFRQRMYMCCTLTGKHWLALKNHLESKGIPVRNECILLPPPSIKELM